MQAMVVKVRRIVKSLWNLRQAQGGNVPHMKRKNTNNTITYCVIFLSSSIYVCEMTRIQGPMGSLTAD